MIRIRVLLLFLLGFTPLSAEEASADPLSKAVEEGKITVQERILSVETLDDLSEEVLEFISKDALNPYLIRITGDKPTVLNGELRASGNLWIINPNGVVVGPNAVLDTGGLFVSTLDLLQFDPPSELLDQASTPKADSIFVRSSKGSLVLAKSSVSPPADTTESSSPDSLPAEVIINDCRIEMPVFNTREEPENEPLSSQDPQLELDRIIDQVSS